MADPRQEARAPMDAASIRNSDSDITITVHSIEGIYHAATGPRISWDLAEITDTAPPA